MAVLDPVTPNLALPTIFHAGDSLSIGMVDPLRTALSGQVNILRPPENCTHTNYWLQQLEYEWLNPTRNHLYEMILFNSGLHDVVTANSIDEETYESNLESIIAILRARCRNAHLVWVNTTYVGPAAAAPGRTNTRVNAYNAVAADVMNAVGIEILDMYAASYANYPDWYYSGGLDDDVHLTTSGYAAAAAVLQANIEARLGL